MKNSAMPSGIFLLLCLLFSVPSWGQADQSARVQELIRQATERMDKALTELKERLAAGTMTEEQFEEALENAMEKFEEDMDKAADDLEDAFDWEDGDVVRIESDSVKNKVKIKISKSHREKRTKTYFLLNFGPTDAFEQLDREGVAYPTFKPWRSWSGNVGLVASSRLGGSSSFVYLNYGLLWKFTYLETKDDLQLSLVDGHPSYIAPDPSVANSLNKSQFSRQSLVVPLQLRFAGKGANALNVMLGGYGGLRLYAFQDLEYKTAIGEEARLRLRDDYKTNLWQYGATAAIGQRWWQLYADYELSNLFQDNPNYEYNVFNTGIQFFF
jgi:flagellar hook-basal body complex protein FliE